jgi:hypothetical protein
VANIVSATHNINHAVFCVLRRQLSYLDVKLGNLRKDISGRAKKPEHFSARPAVQRLKRGLYRVEDPRRGHPAYEE